MNCFNGFPVKTTSMLQKTITEPIKRNRNKRINKKWIKKYGYRSRQIPDKKVYILNNCIYGHPKTIEKLIKAMEVHEK
jgi:hypothetical protein